MSSDKYEQLCAAFKLFDTDGDGQLSTNEMAAVLSRGTNPLLSPTQIMELIAEFDANDEGADEMRICFQ